MRTFVVSRSPGQREGPYVAVAVAPASDLEEEEG